jgi:hypothetical protein
VELGGRFSIEEGLHGVDGLRQPVEHPTDLLADRELHPGPPAERQYGTTRPDAFGNGGHLLRVLGVDARDLKLQVSVPVALRRTGDSVAGNAVGGIRVPVPLDTDPEDPAALLGAVASATRARKAGPKAGAGFGMLGSELMPVPLLRAILGRALRGDQRFINVYVTDLAGPPSRVSIAAADIAEAFPIGPLSAGVGLGAAALS